MAQSHPCGVESEWAFMIHKTASVGSCMLLVSNQCNEKSVCVCVCVCERERERVVHLCNGKNINNATQ